MGLLLRSVLHKNVLFKWICAVIKNADSVSTG